MLRFGIFHILFKDGEYRGFFAIMTDEDGAFIHLGTTGGRYAIKDVCWCLPKAQSIAANVYGITELFCEVDEDSLMSKLVNKLGFTKESASTYKITYHGQNQKHLNQSSHLSQLQQLSRRIQKHNQQVTQSVVVWQPRRVALSR